jgi:hypothetical protein
LTPCPINTAEAEMPVFLPRAAFEELRAAHGFQFAICHALLDDLLEAVINRLVGVPPVVGVDVDLDSGSVSFQEGRK